MTIYQEFPVPSSKLFVWLFIPYYITEEGWTEDFYDNPVTRQQLANVFAELGIKWKWQPITFDNMHAVIDEVAASSKDYIPVVLNYCNGNEIDGLPGISLIKLLEAKDFIFTGGDSKFFHVCDSKIRLKRAFMEAGVATAPYEVISDISRIQGVCDRLGTPLIVKPATYYGSHGISVNSVVHNDEEVSAQVQRLLEGQHGMKLTPEDIYVERFINGSEFTVLIVGTPGCPETIKIYPPVERVFHSSLPEEERLFSYETSWGRYQEETPPPPGESFYHYQLVDSTFHERLCELSWRAYCAVGGNGYGRVDLRMDKASQQLFVLEVNSLCSIDSPQNKLSSVGNILRLANILFAQLMSEIIAEAFARYSTKSRLLNKSV